MGKKIYNVILNSINALNYLSATNSLNYYIDWSAILPEANKNFLLTWTYMGSNNYINGFDFPIVSINFNTNNFINTTRGASNTQIIGRLKGNMITNSSYIGYFNADITDNSPTMIKGRP